MPELADALADWVVASRDCAVEEGLSSDELARAETSFGVQIPPLWKAVLRRVHPVELPVSPRGPDGVLRHTRFPDWRLRDEGRTRELLEAPVDGLLFDVERNGFWWHEWGDRPHTMSQRLRLAADNLALVPRLTPLWGHWYVASNDDSPVFSIVQADLYVPAMTLGDLLTGRSEDQEPIENYPLGNVPFWSLLHAYSQIGHTSRFGELGSGGL